MMSRLELSNQSASHNAMLAAGDRSLVPRDARVLVAVSGGADSMALLGWMMAQRVADANGDCGLVTAHVNHGLRGSESEADEAFARARCQALNVRCVVERVEFAGRIDDAHTNEDTARRARYTALIRMARAENCSLVATGHTSSDSLETMLLFWMRGATVAGWRGIRSQRPLARGLTLVRPLLDVSREETRRWCRDMGWPWREDASNADPKYRRNRVRNELLPLLCDVAGRDEAAFAKQARRAARIMGDDLDCLDALANSHLESLALRREDHLLSLDGLRFQGLPVALQRRVLRLAARTVRANAKRGLDESIASDDSVGEEAHARGELIADARRADAPLHIDVGAQQIESVRHHIALGGRRMVWSWRLGLRVEWTGAMAGNRIRLWLVETAEQEADSSSSSNTSESV